MINVLLRALENNYTKSVFENKVNLDLRLMHFINLQRLEKKRQEILDKIHEVNTKYEL